MAYLQASSVSRTVYLTLADAPATGVIYSDVTAKIKKNSSPSFVTKTLVSGDWHEHGNGLYSITFGATDTDVLGDFSFQLSGSNFDNFLYDEFTIEPQPAVIVNPTIPQQCIVSGSLANIMALPPSQEPLKIVAYPVQLPAKFATTILSGDVAWTFADALGNFSLALARKATVIIEIKRCGIRAQIDIPDAPTAVLTDLLPAFSIDYSL